MGSRLGILCLFAAAAAPAPPDTPTITEPSVDGQIVAPADVHMEAAAYSDPDGDPHASSDWEILPATASETVWQAHDAAGLLRTHIHLADGSFVNSYAGRTELEPDRSYLLRVRFRDASGQASPWAERTFRTSPAGTPGLPAPIPWAPARYGYRIESVASGFQLPVTIAFHPSPGTAPSDPLFYVTELYGTIKVVFRDGTAGTYASGLLNYDPSTLGSFPGAGEQGLTGLCVDPATGDLFATMLYHDAAAKARYPRIVRLTSSDGGRTGSVAAEFRMPGEPQGQSHQISTISIGPDGKLYVHNGDGFDPSTAQNLASFRGKILRLNPDFTAPPDNPSYNASDGITARDFVWAYGVRNPFGGRWSAGGELYMVENGPSIDRLARIVAGRNFGWDGTNSSMLTQAIYAWNPSHAPVHLAFIEPQTFGGSGFPPEMMGRAFITESGPTYATGPQTLGKRIVECALPAGDTPLSDPPRLFAEYIGTGKATAVALAAGPDGLYFSDLYRDQGASSPKDAGAKIWRIRYAGTPPAGSGSGALAEYFPTPDLSGTPVVRRDPTIDFSWPGTTAPAPGLPGDGFSARWRARLRPPVSDTWTFVTDSDDGVRLRLNGRLLIDNWTDHAVTQNSASIDLVGGRAYDLVLEYYDRTGDGRVRLRWVSAGNPLETIPAERLEDPSAPADGPDSRSRFSCGLLGAEALLFAGFAARALRRRRRRAPPPDGAI
ncbi:MAG TPA: PQQ-dependent sugar dehydrogenase [Planctomycetota bacterium]|nr:PQQ-dependent sugar dehydrogenase [Planctomycetota bacterium]